MWGEVALETNAAGGRMRVIKVRGFSVKSLTAVLLFIGAFGEADVGLLGESALLERVHALSITPRGVKSRVNSPVAPGPPCASASNPREPIRPSLAPHDAASLFCACRDPRLASELSRCPGERWRFRIPWRASADTRRAWRAATRARCANNPARVGAPASARAGPQRDRDSG